MATIGKWRIKKSDIPLSVPIHQYIFDKTDFLVQTKKFKNYFHKDYLKTNIFFDQFKFQQDIKEALDLYGTFPFSYYNRKSNESYLSISLNYNPYSIDKLSLNPHQGTLGSSIGSFKSLNQYTNNLLGKNTYNDTLSFVDRTPISYYKSLGQFIDGLKRTMIRSRISILYGVNEDTRNISFGWHNDESIFLNLRVNIPVQTTENYSIQILNDSDITSFNLERGYAFAYDTNKYHRACSTQSDTLPRINLILGISPWFDYCFETEAWVSNEFYGEYHPFEMLENKLVSNMIGRK